MRGLPEGLEMSPFACSFCGKTARDGVKILVGPPNACICSECLEVCNYAFGVFDQHDWELAQAEGMP